MVCYSQVFSVPGGWWYAVASQMFSVPGGWWYAVASQMFSAPVGWWYAVARCSQYRAGGGMLKPGVLSTGQVVV